MNNIVKMSLSPKNRCATHFWVMSSLLSCRHRPVWTLSLVGMQPICDDILKSTLSWSPSANVPYVLCRWHAFDWKAFLFYSISLFACLISNFSSQKQFTLKCCVRESPCFGKSVPENGIVPFFVCSKGFHEKQFFQIPRTDRQKSLDL